MFGGGIEKCLCLGCVERGEIRDGRRIDIECLRNGWFRKEGGNA
jgi:hypothetical protein